MKGGSGSAPQAPAGHTPGDDSQCSPTHENSQFDIKQVSGSFALSFPPTPKGVHFHYHYTWL